MQKRLLTLVVRLRREPSAEAGFTLVEMLVSMVVFITVAVAVVGMLTSALAAHKLARDRTAAEEAVTDHLEMVRRKPYQSIGNPYGNPPGDVPTSTAVSLNSLVATIKTKVSYVNDPIQGATPTGANYKKIAVTLTRTRDSSVLAKQTTYVAPPERAAYGGINNAIINAQVVDMVLNTGVPDIMVDLETGPSARRTDTTDAQGRVVFSALTPNPSSGPDAYYDLVAAEDTADGYEPLRDDLPPATPAHVQLAPSQTFNTALRVYKPARISVNLTNASGGPYTSAATVTIGSSRGAQEFAVTGGSLTVTSLNGEPVVPNLSYSVAARAQSGSIYYFARVAARTVPNSYPTDLTSTFNLQLLPLPKGDLNIIVRTSSGNIPVPSAFVQVSGGPLPVYMVGTANSGGVIPFAVPVGTGYTVYARSPSGLTGTATPVTSVLNGTTNVTVQVR